MLKYLFLVVGFVLLIKGADFFVDGSSSVAKSARIPSLIIGMTIVAMGTSLPETSVSVSASLAGKNDLAISNAVGSNIFNLMVVCGICSAICPLKISVEALRRDFPTSIVAAGILVVAGAYGNTVGRIDGIIFLSVFAVFLIIMIQSARRSRAESAETDSEEDYKILPSWKSALYIVGGIAAIAVGGKLVVESASAIARAFGMSDNLIGMTVVALGTSLPELVTSIVASKKNEPDMALGNVIGSNIFNILFVLGIASTISPMTYTTENFIDTVVLIAMSAIVFLYCLKDNKLVRWHGISMLVIYSAYTAYIFTR